MLRVKSVLCTTRSLLMIGLLVATVQSSASAALLTTLTEGVGTTVNANFSGNVTYTGALVPSKSFAQLLLPISGEWLPPFSTGNWLTNNNNFANDDLNSVTASGSITISVTDESPVVFNVTSVTILDSVDSNPSRDTILFVTNTGLPDYPTVEVNDVISWTGSVLFDVNSGTFASNFNPSPIPYTADHGNGIEVALQVGASAVPEPSGLMLALLGGMTIALLAYRSRSQVRVVS